MENFPAVITADDVAATDHSPQELWQAIGEGVEEQLARSGAVLLRGFDLADAQDFDALIEATRWPSFTYAESLSNAVRVNVTERVFTANEAPPDVAIHLHHEMAQTPIYPSRLLFFCEFAPGEGGATPICRSDLLHAKIAAELPEFAEKCQRLGLRYTNIMPGSDDAASGQGRSWASTLSVTTRAEAEAKLKVLGYEWGWGDDREGEEPSLRVTTSAMPAVRVLEDGTISFFNQLIAAWIGWADTPEGEPDKVTFGDGSAIDADDMAHVIALSEEVTADCAWQQGDVAILDNYRVMHGRRPFRGKRRVLASLIGAA
ncbi:TauD/TfdA family dioxygenase [Alterisphingorhabdus coralli]|uniref:TauD/TfdA family dioxygenase n=1 Tax=Alterisphingorhabdus coralli TaxID=3071408 RepID=A0AA97F745_9SPHN|nr:TauD/TfdA family dioxygenase [Parasphingorhabdus sp. SCSIO 66989]WOE74483.1 TauD/TfdA family dioxygenase [Parasphingorhabdus sp. SCSIO 66989]